jgi:hypothetical protein
VELYLHSTIRLLDKAFIKLRRETSLRLPVHSLGYDCLIIYGIAYKCAQFVPL